MRSVLFVAASLALLSNAPAETFQVDTAHAQIGFSVKHMMVSNTKGKFNTFKGTLDYDISRGNLKSMQGSIEAASIDTNHEGRDDHLRNEDFFNVVKFPKITFTSTSVKKTGMNTFEVSGKLNILGIDRMVVLPITINGPVDGRRGKVIGIESSLTLNRRDLGLTHSPAAMIGDEVKISIEAEAAYK